MKIFLLFFIWKKFLKNKTQRVQSDSSENETNSATLHYHHTERAQRYVLMGAFLLHPRMLFISEQSLVPVLGGWGSASLVYVRMPLFFSFQLQVFGSVGVETPDLQIYHVNEEGIYKMRTNQR